MQAYKIMHGLWGMGQMMFTKYIVVVDDDVDVHNTSDVLFERAQLPAGVPEHFRPPPPRRFGSAPFTALHRPRFKRLRNNPKLVGRRTSKRRERRAPSFDFAGLSRRRKRGSLSGMSATLTINLDSDVLQLAEQEARSRHTTIPEVVAHQLRVMARNWQESKAGKTPVTDALRGAVKLPPDFDERAALTEELQKKHGVQG